jgi:UDP-N-acetylmuramoyl-tripeptide--D-alanyl-D-alanine ligase
VEPRSLKFIANACGGTLTGDPETLVGNVSTDSRSVSAGDLFWAIPGERFDGHAFLDEAARRGAGALVAESGKIGGRVFEKPWIAVKNSRQALGNFAGAYSAAFAVEKIAVAGSNGKTTTKEFIAAVLRGTRHPIWSEGSFNNDLGVPFTLLKIEGKHDCAVLEVGTNHPGELAPLLQLISPRLGVITSIGREHLEFFRTLEGVVEEEGMLAEILPQNGTLFLQGDSPWTERIARRCRGKVVTAGLNPGNQITAEAIQMDETGMTFVARGTSVDGAYRIGLLGAHHVSNALLAIAVGAELGVERAVIERGLRECAPAKMRMQISETRGIKLMEDCYNANVDSTLCALRTFREWPCAGRRVALLGDMAELGVEAEAAHREIGIAAAGVVEALFCVGEFSRWTVEAAREAGLAEATWLPNAHEVAGLLGNFLREGDALLLKGSRSAKLERVSEFLKGTN